LDAPKLETALRDDFTNQRVNMFNNCKKFYNVILNEIEEVVQQNDKTVDFSISTMHSNMVKVKELRKTKTYIIRIIGSLKRFRTSYKTRCVLKE